MQNFYNMPLIMFEKMVYDIIKEGNIKKLEELILNLHMDQRLSYEGYLDIVKAMRRKWNDYRRLLH